MRIAPLLLFIAFIPGLLAAADSGLPLTQSSELKNRFRIDHMVDEVTLVIQREFGSAPVVVVLPDGSKWYTGRHPDTVKWTDSVSGDMISVKHPMPGPWQLLGKVVKGSQITRISQLGIWVDPLPQPLYQGERLKLTAGLTGDKLRMRLPGLEYMVQWTAQLVSEHQPGDENFAVGTLIVGSYQDNGQNLDERPDDGVFTSDINLNQPWGRYTLNIHVGNEVFERDYQQPVLLSPRPGDIKVLEPEDLQHPQWSLQLTADPKLLQLPHTYFQLELVGPTGIQISMTVGDLAEAESTLALPQVTEHGSYRIKGTLFSTDWAGREIVVTLPERFFNFVEAPPPAPDPQLIAAQKAEQDQQQEQQAKSSALLWIVVGNVLLLLVGSAVLLFLRKRRMLQQALASAEKELAAKQPQQKTLKTQLQEIDLTMPDDDESKR